MTSPDYGYIHQLMSEHVKTLVQFDPNLATLPSPTNNPYWEKIKTLPGETDVFSGKWHPKTYDFNRVGEIERYRDSLVQTYAWAIPDPLALQFIVEQARGGIVEVACGTGYWLWQLSQLGVDVIGYDQYPPHLSANNHWHRPLDADYQPTGELGKHYIDIQVGTPEILTLHSDRTLFLCWPPYDSDMATECLKHYHGKRLIYIGEGDGGCTGDDVFHETLDQEWDVVDNHCLVQWDGIHDFIAVYDRVM